MTISDKINLAIAIVTALGIIASLIIAVLTLRQSSKQAKESREMNEKMIEESTRPNLHLFTRPSYKGGDYGRMVLKNFGNSAANIISVVIPEITLMPGIEEKTNSKPFSNIVNSTFPPGYEIETLYKYSIEVDNPFYELEIEYSSGTHTYRDVLSVNLRQNKGTLKMSPSSGLQFTEYVSESLQVIAQSLFTKV